VARAPKPVDESARPLCDPLPFVVGVEDPIRTGRFASCATNLAPNPPPNANEIPPKFPIGQSLAAEKRAAAAAAAAQELLKADAQRELRAKAAAQKRKTTGGPAAAAPEMKRKATGGAAAAPEQMSSGRAGHALEQNGASSSLACTPPISVIDGSCFFNGAGSFFGNSPLSQPWMLSSDPATCQCRLVITLA